jgi:hypothetical protein
MDCMSWYGVLHFKSPSHWDCRPRAGEGEVNCTIAAGTSPSPRFARPFQREGDFEYVGRASLE